MVNINIMFLEKLENVQLGKPDFRPLLLCVYLYVYAI